MWKADLVGVWSNRAIMPFTDLLKGFSRKASSCEARVERLSDVGGTSPYARLVCITSQIGGSAPPAFPSAALHDVLDAHDTSMQVHFYGERSRSGASAVTSPDML